MEAKPLGSRVVAADPADDHVLACGATAGVDFIATGDTHLLRIARFAGAPILTPAAYLRAT